jgi:hypothetical protein
VKLTLDESEKVEEHVVLGSELGLQGLDVVVTHAVSLREQLVDMLVLGLQEGLVGLHGLGRGIKQSLIVGEQVGVFAVGPCRGWWQMALPGVSQGFLFLKIGCISARLKVLPPEVIVPLKIIRLPNWWLEDSIILLLSGLLNTAESRDARIFCLPSVILFPIDVLRLVIRGL